MSLDITGASAADTGPEGTVVRFLLAGDARDVDACRAELHETSFAIAEATPEPPPMKSAHVGEAVAVEEDFHVPVAFVGNDDSEQPFVFVVRRAQNASGYGIDLQATMHATFGGDPAEMMMNALKDALTPAVDMMGEFASGIQSAFSGMSSGDALVPTRISLSESVTQAEHQSVSPFEMEIVRMEFSRSISRAFGEDDSIRDTSLTIRCEFRLNEDIVLKACEGVTLTRAESTEGEDLLPEFADESLGAEGYSSWEQEQRAWSLSLGMRPPSTAFRGIAHLAGIMRMRIDSKQAYEIPLGRIADLIGQRTFVEALQFEYAFLRDENGAFSMQTAYGGLDTVEILFFDDTDQEIYTGSSGYGDGETSTRTFDPDLPDDAQVLLRWTPEGEVVTAPFVMRGLPFYLD
jgi:hypothetical protein